MVICSQLPSWPETSVSSHLGASGRAEKDGVCWSSRQRSHPAALSEGGEWGDVQTVQVVGAASVF